MRGRSRTRIGVYVAGALLVAGTTVLALRGRQPLAGTDKLPAVARTLLEADPLHVVCEPERHPRTQPDPVPGILHAKVLSGGELRNALVLPTTSRFSIQTEIPSISYLRIGAALVRDAADVRRPGVTFTVNAVLAKDGARRKLFSRYIDPWYNEADRSWVDASVGLSRESQAVTLEFETRSESGAVLKGLEYAAWSYPQVLPFRPHHRPNVILVSVDTLRADRLGCYGYALRPTSPSIDRLSSQGVRFAHACAQAPWTTPSHASMLTGLYPSRHGVVQDPARVEELAKARRPVRLLHRSTATLASRLRQAGYDTAAFTGGVTVAAGLGFAQGFDTVREEFGGLTDHHRWLLRDWIAGHDRRPFLLFLHTFEVHAPYLHDQFASVPPERVAAFRELLAHPGDARLFFDGLKTLALARVDVTSALYDGGVRHVDDFLGEVMQDLEALGKQDETVVIVTSDHGEEFADHHPDRFYNAHAFPMYEELLAVPLILRFPPRIHPGIVVDRPVRSIDIVPTVLDLVGLPQPEDVDGRSLAPLFEPGGARNRPLSILSEASAGEIEIKSLRRGRYKYIARTNGPAWTNNMLVEGGDELYDLALDPRERRNIVADHGGLATEMRQEIWNLVERSRRLRPPPGKTEPLGPELHEGLRALGYVQ